MGKVRERKQIQKAEQIQSGSEMDGKPQSKTLWGKIEKGSRKYSRADTVREEIDGKPQSKMGKDREMNQKQRDEQIHSRGKKDGKPLSKSEWEKTGKESIENRQTDAECEPDGWEATEQGKQKQKGEEIKNGSEMDGKPQSKTLWEKIEKGSRKNSRADTVREEIDGKPQSKAEWEKIEK